MSSSDGEHDASVWDLSSSDDDVEPDTSGHVAESADEGSLQSGEAAAKRARRSKLGAKALKRHPSHRFPGQFPPGPTSAAELHEWPARFCMSLSQLGLWPNVLVKLAEGGVLCSDYTGSGCMDQAALMLRLYVNAGRESEGQEPLPCFRTYRACDSDLRCQTLLRQHMDVQEHASHVFKDIHDRVEIDVMEQLQAICSESKKKVGQAEAALNLAANCTSGKNSCKQHIKALAGIQCEELIRVLRSHGENCMKSTSWCTSHDMECPLNDMGTKFTVWSGGNRCLDWTTFGARRNWAGDDTLPFIIWCFSILRAGPDVVIQECTPQFDLTYFRQILEDCYTIQHRVICPSQLGFPVSRARQWAIAVRTSKWTLLEQFDGPSFENMFYREIMLNADVYFQTTAAGDAEVAQLITRRAKRRGLTPHQSDGQPWPFRSIASPGLLARLEGYRLLAEAEGNKCFVANISQNPDVMPLRGCILPTLLTRSCYALLRSDKVGLGLHDDPWIMTSDQALGAMGWPIAGLGASPTIQNLLEPPLATMKPQFKYHVAGNGMHVAVAASVLVWVLAMTVDA